MYCNSVEQAKDCAEHALRSNKNTRPCLWSVGLQPFSITRRLLCYSNVRQERSCCEKMEEQARRHRTERGGSVSVNLTENQSFAQK